MYKITIITTERSCTLDGRTFTIPADLFDSNRNRIEFADLSTAELFARAWAAANGAKYLEIGNIDTPALGEKFVEIRCA